jgi:hypothetical protein
MLVLVNLHHFKIVSSKNPLGKYEELRRIWCQNSYKPCGIIRRK